MIIIDPLIRIAIIAVDLYIWVIIIGAMMSWLVAFNIINTTNQFVCMVIDFIYRITEPALRPIRRVIPNFGSVDISPIALILSLIFLKMVLGNLHRALLTG